jgi:hypothetical protein
VWVITTFLNFNKLKNVVISYLDVLGLFMFVDYLYFTLRQIRYRLLENALLFCRFAR